MHTNPINEKTQRVLEKVKKCKFIGDFYLVGGTALAIQLGHRESIDLDFFSRKLFSVSDIEKELSLIGKYILNKKDEKTLDGILDGVKISFFYYDYDQLYPFVKFSGIKLADEKDIACMKIDAISSRGSKKDFIDFYFLLKKYSLTELISFFEKKYSNIEFNKLHILKSLTYFKDAENEPMPIMIKNVDWVDVRKKIIEETKKIVK